MNRFSFLKIFLLSVAAVFTIVACDHDFAELDGSVIDGDIHNSTHRYYGKVVAYDRATGAIQTNNLDVNTLGVYDHPVFGKTKAHYITQLLPASFSPTFTSNVEIDSAWVYVPLYSRVTGATTVSDEATTTYRLDSIYGDTTATFKVKLRKNTYYLRSGDPATGGSQSQAYYSNDRNIFESYQTENLLDTPDATVSYSAKEIKRKASYVDDEGETQTVTAEKLAPGLFMYLNKDFFKRNIVNAPAGSLTNSNTFNEYFRGISFMVDQMDGKSVISPLNFNNGYIKVIVKQDDLDSSGNVQYEDDAHTIIKKESITITLNMRGVRVNLFENEYSQNYLTAVSNSNVTEGDSRLHIKGGEGSITLLDILSDDDINILKQDSILINEANLIFYVDNSANGMNGYGAAAKREAPKRLYLYDVNNKRPLYDYYTDGTTATDTRFNKYLYGGILNTDKNNRPYYKIRITNHIANIVSRDSTNVKIGLAVTGNINTVTNSALKNPLTENYAGSTLSVKTAPVGSVQDILGTVLYGPNIPEGDPDYDKRLRLEIFYTKPEN